jgi:hypothetical protein
MYLTPSFSTTICINPPIGFEDGEIGMQSLVAAGMQAVDVRLMKGNYRTTYQLYNCIIIGLIFQYFFAGYPHVVPSTTSVLAPADDADADGDGGNEGSEADSGTGIGAGSKRNRAKGGKAKGQYSVGHFACHAALVLGLAYVGGHFLQEFMFRAMLEERWNED